MMGWVSLALLLLKNSMWGMLGAGFDCLQALGPGMLPLTKVFPKAPGPEIPAQAHFCLKPSDFTQGRYVAGLCWGAAKSQQRETSFPCGLWHEGSLPLLNLHLALGGDSTWHLQSQAGGEVITKQTAHFCVPCQ